MPIRSASAEAIKQAVATIVGEADTGDTIIRQTSIPARSAGSTFFNAYGLLYVTR